VGACTICECRSSPDEAGIARWPYTAHWLALRVILTAGQAKNKMKQ